MQLRIYFLNAKYEKMNIPRLTIEYYVYGLKNKRGYNKNFIKLIQKIIQVNY